MTAPTFDKWPPSGPAYQAYQNGRGQTLTRELVIAEYTAKHGQPPAEVWYCKPFLWLAGPVPEPEAPPTVEAVPALEEAMVPLPPVSVCEFCDAAYTTLLRGLAEYEIQPARYWPLTGWTHELVCVFGDDQSEEPEPCLVARPTVEKTETALALDGQTRFL